MTEKAGKSALANSLTYPHVSSPAFRGKELVSSRRLGFFACFKSVGGNRFGRRALGIFLVSSFENPLRITSRDQQQDSRHRDKRIYV